MANNNVLRPPVLGDNNGNDQPTTSNRAIELAELNEHIKRLVVSTIEANITNIAREIRNPVNEIVTDQEIDAQYNGDLDQMDKIPDVVKTLRQFSGNPAEFGSWKKSIERIMKIYETLRGRPRYFGILNIIRNKIVGEADIVLESYNTPLDLKAIMTCLTTHYADKRDLSTLEYQMTCLIQGKKSVQEFYSEVYAHLSLILNKISCLEASAEALNILTKTYREKALDTFIRGLTGDLPRLLGVKGPTDLPEALHLCLKLENQNIRTTHAYSHNARPNMPPKPNRPQPTFNNFYPKLAHIPNNYQQQYPKPNYFAPKSNYPPPRPFGPNPQPKPEPMDVDQSKRTIVINYAKH